MNFYAEGGADRLMQLIFHNYLMLFFLFFIRKQNNKFIDIVKDLIDL